MSGVSLEIHTNISERLVNSRVSKFATIGKNRNLTNKIPFTVKVVQILHLKQTDCQSKHHNFKLPFFA